MVPAGIAARVGDAYREYRHLQHGLRPNQAPHARVERASAAGMIGDVTRLWELAFAAGEEAVARG